MVKHETRIRVQYYETDAMGIVHHSNYIRYFETARTEFFRSRGYSYDRMEKSGVYMPNTKQQYFMTRKFQSYAG